MKKALTALLLAAALLLSLGGCGRHGGDPEASASGSVSSAQTDVSSPPEESARPFALPFFPQAVLNPATAVNRSNLTLSALLYEPLFQVDRDFQAVPVLCTGAEASYDKLTWTLTLRSGVTFSDGAALTGQRVAEALNAARAAGASYAQRLACVASVTGDETTVTITLNTPNGALPLLLDVPISLGGGDRPLGTGPYVLTETDGTWSLTARSGWWQGTALPWETIPLSALNRTDELPFSFSSGDISLVDVDLMGSGAAGYSGNYQTWDYPTTDMIYIGFNTQRGQCQHAAVRSALARAIDRTAAAQTIYASHAVASALPVHPASGLYDEGVAARLAYDPAQAAQDLSDANVLGRTLTLIVNSESAAKVSLANQLASQLEHAGMRIQVRSLSFEEYSAALSSGSFDLYVGEVILTADFDLFPLLSPEGALNYGRWQDETGLGFLTSFRASLGDDRPSTARALCFYLAEEVPLAAVCFKNSSVLTPWGRVSGLEPVRGNVFYHLDSWSLS